MMKHRTIGGKHFSYIANRGRKSQAKGVAKYYRRTGHRVNDVFARLDKLSKRDIKARRKQ